MDSVVAVGVIIGVGNAVKTQFPKVSGLFGVALSVVLGIVLGFFHYLGVADVQSGILVGLSASGVYTVAKRVGGK